MGPLVIPSYRGTDQQPSFFISAAARSLIRRRPAGNLGRVGSARRRRSASGWRGPATCRASAGCPAPCCLSDSACSLGEGGRRLHEAVAARKVGLAEPVLRVAGHRVLRMGLDKRLQGRLGGRDSRPASSGRTRDCTARWRSRPAACRRRPAPARGGARQIVERGGGRLRAGSACRRSASARRQSNVPRVRPSAHPARLVVSDPEPLRHRRRTSGPAAVAPATRTRRRRRGADRGLRSGAGRLAPCARRRRCSSVRPAWRTCSTWLHDLLDPPGQLAHLGFELIHAELRVDGRGAVRRSSGPGRRDRRAAAACSGRARAGRAARRPSGPGPGPGGHADRRTAQTERSARQAHGASGCRNILLSLVKEDRAGRPDSGGAARQCY